MLIIRDEQMLVLLRAKEGAFIERLAADLERFYPDACERLGRQGVRAVVERGIVKAAEYRIGRAAEVGQFLLLMFELGFDFDLDPWYDWAYRILRHTRADAQERLDLLFLFACPPEPELQQSRSRCEA